MINEEVSRSGLNLEVRLAKATSKAILDALKKVHKQIEEQGGLKNVIKNNGEEVKLKDMVKKGQLEEINLKDPELKELKKILNKHGVRFSVMKDKETGNHSVFFQSKDIKVMEHAFKKQLRLLKESIVTLRDKNYKNTRAIKDTEKKIDDRVQLIDHAEKYSKHKNTYKSYIKLKKSKQEDFYNEHTAEIILFESAKKYLKEHLVESKTLAISKCKSEAIVLKKEKDSLYSQILDMRKEVEQAEKVKICIEQL
ncbi:PcfB family protein [Peptoniphilus porci]|uniref:PcfB family protein n=1 Tax=Peptoniphilus porci TaxID=2652280 RepID=UPI000952FC75|nr:PcfB family protein [Peptoniphilus porci]